MPEQVSDDPSQLTTDLHPDAIVVLKAIVNTSGDWYASYPNIVQESKLPSGKVTIFIDKLLRDKFIERIQGAGQNYYKASTKGLDFLVETNNIDFSSNR